MENVEWKIGIGGIDYAVWLSQTSGRTAHLAIAVLNFQFFKEQADRIRYALMENSEWGME